MNKVVEQLLTAGSDSSDLVSELMRRGAEFILQRGLEEEVTDFLGREHYERGSSRHRGYRNGYQDRRIKTSEGTLQVRRPRVRESEETFESELLRRIGSIEERLKQMAIEMYVRGLSTRDIEATLTDEDGKPLLSRSGTSRLAEALMAEYEAFIERDLSVFDVVFLFVDGVYEAVKHYTNHQAILCAWGVQSDGSKLLLHMECAASESEAAWSSFFASMLDRGLAQPLLIVSDGANGLTAAISRCFPKSDRQRCIAHKMRNLSAKLPKHERDVVMAQIRAVYYAPDIQTARTLAERLIDEHSHAYPAMVKCFCDDLEACLVHLNYPLAHRKFIRTTNQIERAFCEEKRRTKIIPLHVNERGAIKLVYGVLIRASARWKRVTMTSIELTQLRNIRKMMCPESKETQTISFRLAA